jgi:hypothetical protein
MIIARLSHKEIAGKYWDEVAVKSTFKVSKAATTKQIAEELAAALRIGATCNHEHDCCGCWSNWLLRVKRTKRGEVFATYSRTANV